MHTVKKYAEKYAKIFDRNFCSGTVLSTAVWQVAKIVVYFSSCHWHKFENTTISNFNNYTIGLSVLFIP